MSDDRAGAEGGSSADRGGAEEAGVMTRRNFLTAVGVAAAGFLAGCSAEQREQFFRKHFLELSPAELDERISRIRAECKDRFGKDIDLKGTRLPNLDQFWSALLDDLDQRGLLETTLVIWMGEFGRTPKINGQAGRDHWAYTNAIGLSGAGIKMGTVVGQTDRRCERPAGTPHTTHDFAATIYHLLGIDGRKEYIGPDGRPHLLNYHGTPIAEALA